MLENPAILFGTAGLKVALGKLYDYVGLFYSYFLKIYGLFWAIVELICYLTWAGFWSLLGEFILFNDFWFSGSFISFVGTERADFYLIYSGFLDLKSSSKF